MKNSFDVIIVGAGMVGASLALLLRKYMAQGLSVALIDDHQIDATQGQQPSFDDRTTALSLGTQRIFEALSLWSGLASASCAIEHIQVSQQGQFGRVRLHAKDESVAALGYVIPNRALGQVLSQALLESPQLSIFAPASVEHYQINSDGACLQLQLAGETIELTGRLLVLADGVNSAGCQQLGIAQRRHDYGQTALVCNVSFDRPHDHWAFERFTRGGPLALLPMQGNRFALVWCMPHEQAQAHLALGETEFNLRLQQAVGFDKGRIIKSGDRSCYPLVLSQAAEQVRSHLVVLGNAAHGLHPVAGQGFNLALRDAKALANSIAQTWQQHGADQLGQLPHLLSYQYAQGQDQTFTIGLSHHLPVQFAQSGAAWSLVRSVGLTMLDTLPVAKTLFARQAMGLVGSAQTWQP
ncbi:MAG: 2-octaprenyl-6-methoxyphenol hydroxylase [Oceanicoccus sp.]|jgi:2-octaprenyl-6-methoxyphenol hydroxylase